MLLCILIHETRTLPLLLISVVMLYMSTYTRNINIIATSNQCSSAIMSTYKTNTYIFSASRQCSSSIMPTQTKTHTTSATKHCSFGRYYAYFYDQPVQFFYYDYLYKKTHTFPLLLDNVVLLLCLDKNTYTTSTTNQCSSSYERC